MKKFMFILIMLIVASVQGEKLQTQYDNYFMFGVDVIYSPIRFKMNNMDKKYIVKLKGLYSPSWAKKRKVLKMLRGVAKKEDVIQLQNCTVEYNTFECEDIVFLVSSYRKMLLRKKMAKILK